MTQTHPLKTRSRAQITNALLDLDGTLTDPFDGIAASICHAMKCLGIRTPSHAELRAAIGPPLRQTFARLLQPDSGGRIEDAMRFYRECYSVTGFLENRVYPSIPKLLANLNAAGCRLFVVTSKPTLYARRIIRHFELEGYFAAIYGSELDGRLENKSDLIRFVLKTEGLSAHETAIIGDRSHDMLGAKANGARAVGVTWGYGSLQELEEAGADVICTCTHDVLRFLTGTFNP